MRWLFFCELQSGLFFAYLACALPSAVTQLLQVAALRRAGRRAAHTVARAGLEFPAGLIGGARRYWTRAALVSFAGLVSSGGAGAGSIPVPPTGAPNGGRRFLVPMVGAYLEL